MTPSPDLISAVLALPLEARRLLAQQPGPGWLAAPGGSVGAILPNPPAFPCPRFSMDEHLAAGYAWLPANDTAWMRAATPEGGFWTRASDEVWTIFLPSSACRDGYLPLGTATTAPECAVAALRARFGP